MDQRALNHTDDGLAFTGPPADIQHLPLANLNPCFNPPAMCNLYYADLRIIKLCRYRHDIYDSSKATGTPPSKNIEIYLERIAFQDLSDL